MAERLRAASPLVLAALLLASGVAHVVVPSSYERIVPRWLGHPRALVLGSGAAEILVAALLARRRTRRLGAWSAAGLLVVVFPANVQMALDGGIPGKGFPLGSPVLAWARLPVQVPLVAWAVRIATRRAPARHPAPVEG